MDGGRAGGPCAGTGPGANAAKRWHHPLFDIHTTPRAHDDIVGKALNRSLYSWDSAAGKVVLELAKDVAISEDGLIYVYKLRDDVYFHNGRKMTADDIIWSYTRIMDGSRGFPGARYIRMIKGAVDVEKNQAKEISGLRKIDDFTLEMTLTDKVEPGYYLFNGTTAILPKEEEGRLTSHPIGLGPFKFVEHIPGSRVVAERWEKFYKPGKPYADRFVLLMMPEAAARDLAFRSKEIDTSILGPAQYVVYRGDPELSKGILEVAEMFTRSMQFNPAYKPFSDKRVRQAINYAVDTDLIIKRLVKDKAYRATSWLPSASPAFDKSIKPYPFDPEKAKKLLAEAGYPKGFSFKMQYCACSPDHTELAPLLVAYLEQIGVKAELQPMEYAAFLSAMTTRKHAAGYLMGSSHTNPTTSIRKSFVTDQTWNPSMYSDPKLDAKMAEVYLAQDEEKRMEMLREVTADIVAQAPYIWLPTPYLYTAWWPWVKNYDGELTAGAVRPGPIYARLWIDRELKKKMGF